MVFVPHVRRHRQRRSRRSRLVLLVFVLTMLAGGELAARYVLGLGDPPLLVPDPTVEYLNKPGTYRRFGNVVHINPWSMRSPDFERHKARPEELRVLVVGDSVVFGGSLIDDSQTATTLLGADLAVSTGRPVVVANIGAGSWGPPNELAYLEKFGGFDADAMIVVWSSHDAWDVPTFAPLGPDQPTEKSWSALAEGWTRYAWPRLSRRGVVALSPTQEQYDAALAGARNILAWARTREIPVAVVLHKTRSELAGETMAGYDMLKAVAQAAGTPVYESASVLGPAGTRGETVFSDDIHPNGAGQIALAELYARIVADLLRPPDRAAEQGGR